MSRTAMVAWDHTWKALLISVEYPSYLGGSRELIFLSLDVTRSELFLDNSVLFQESASILDFQEHLE